MQSLVWKILLKLKYINIGSKMKEKKKNVSDMVSGGKKKKCYYCIKMLQIASTLWHLLLLQNIWKFTYFPFFPPFLVCLHWRLQLSTSNLCMLNTGPGLCFKLFVMSQIVLGDPPLEIKMQWALNFFFFFCLDCTNKKTDTFLSTRGL